MHGLKAAYRLSGTVGLAPLAITFPLTIWLPLLDLSVRSEAGVSTSDSAPGEEFVFASSNCKGVESEDGGVVGTSRGTTGGDCVGGTPGVPVGGRAYESMVSGESRCLECRRQWGFYGVRHASRGTSPEVAQPSLNICNKTYKQN